MCVSLARTVSRDHPSCKGGWGRGYVAKVRHISVRIRTVLQLVKERWGR